MDYIYSIDNIPVLNKNLTNKISFNDILNAKHITNGGNSNIYFGYYREQKVIVKMIKVEHQNSNTVKSEFNLEYNILLRL